MNKPEIQQLYRLELAVGDEVTAMTTFEGVVIICTRFGRLYTMRDGEPPMRQSALGHHYGPR